MSARRPIFLDSFSGAASDLPKGRRTAEEVLRVLAAHPRISTWDMSEAPWLHSIVQDLLRAGSIVEVPEPYPWHRYALKGSA